jgi:hypothetical protein
MSLEAVPEYVGRRGSYCIWETPGAVENRSIGWNAPPLQADMASPLVDSRELNIAGDICTETRFWPLVPETDANGASAMSSRSISRMEDVGSRLASGVAGV